MAVREFALVDWKELYNIAGHPDISDTITDIREDYNRKIARDSLRHAVQAVYAATTVPRAEALG